MLVAAILKAQAANPVRGKRLSTDRRNELRNPPQFLDEIIETEKPYLSYKISGSGNKNDWRLKTDREMDMPGTTSGNEHLRISTTYRFQVLDFDNQGSCAVTSFDFVATHDGTSASIKRSMSLDSCMDLFLSDKSVEKAMSPAESKTMEFLREDCSMSMHYSLEAKKILAKPRN
jgi:hypothetical protein